MIDQRRKKENEKIEIGKVHAALYQRQTDDLRIWKIQWSRIEKELYPMSINIAAILNIHNYVPLPH
jgi:hypothetical protein